MINESGGHGGPEAAGEFERKYLPMMDAEGMTDMNVAIAEDLVAKRKELPHVGVADPWSVPLYNALVKGYITKDGELTSAGERHYKEGDQREAEALPEIRSALDILAKQMVGAPVKNGKLGQGEKNGTAKNGEKNGPVKNENDRERLSPKQMAEIMVQAKLDKFGRKMIIDSEVKTGEIKGSYTLQLKTKIITKKNNEKEICLFEKTGKIGDILKLAAIFLDKFLDRINSERHPTDGKGNRTKSDKRK